MKKVIISGEINKDELIFPGCVFCDGWNDTLVLALEDEKTDEFIKCAAKMEISDIYISPWED